jgi:hypothetical protein
VTPKPPTLADNVHAWTYVVECPVPSGWLKKRFDEGALSLRMAVRKANRFTLDDDFVRQVVRRANVQPEQMLSLSDLANLPFETVFVEFDNTVRLHAQRDMGTMRDAHLEIDERGRAGFLFERQDGKPGTFKATYFSMDDRHATQNWLIGAASYFVDLSDRERPDLFKGGHEHMREVVEGYPWGYAMETDTPEGFKFFATKELATRGVVLPETRFMKPLIEHSFGDPSRKDSIGRLFANSVVEGRGDLRFIIAMLAMLNHVPTTYRHHTAKGWYRQRLRNVPYLDNRTLTIHCGRAKIVNVVDNAFKGMGSRHRRHEVRGFWRDVEYGKAVRCAHEPIERDGAYCLCGKCGHLLRWIDFHERGDPTLGWVKHDYHVEP